MSMIDGIVGTRHVQYSCNRAYEAQADGMAAEGR
jgi:hypothetical protein